MKKNVVDVVKIKFLEDFTKKTQSKDNHDSWCRNCITEHVTKYRNTEIGFLKKEI